MANVPLDTRFIGIAPTVNLTERKSALINRETAPYTIQDIALSGGSPIFQPLVIEYVGTTAGGISLDLYAGDGYSYNSFGSSEIQAPNLINIYGGIVLIGDYDNGSYANFKSYLDRIEMPLLESIGQALFEDQYPIDIESWGALTYIDLGSLSYVQGGTVYISNNPALTTLNLSSLKTYYGSLLVIYNNPLLTSIDLTKLTTFNGDIQMANCALDQTSVDGILNQLANVVELSNKYVTLSGGTNAIPSTEGLDNVDILVANGCSVSVNS